VALALPMAMGHGYLKEPASRNVVASSRSWPDVRETCPHCLNGGGSKAVDGGGLCGDPQQASMHDEPYMVPTDVQHTYTPGDVAVFTVQITAHHKGHFEFRICDRGLDEATLGTRQEGQDCLNEWVLERVAPISSCSPNDSNPDCQPLDPAHPERWYLPPPSYSMLYNMRYQIPSGLGCQHCTLQWYYSSGNSCTHDSDYQVYFRNMKAEGWSADNWWKPSASICGSSVGEQFWNCADIAVLSSGDQPTPTPAPNPMPTVSVPTPMPTPMTTPEQEPTAEAEPESEEDESEPTPAPSLAPVPTPPSDSSACVNLWNPCGGSNHQPPRCCPAGSYCYEQSVWYHQCRPGRPTLAQQSALTASSDEAKLRGGRRTNRHQSMMLLELVRKASKRSRISEEEFEPVAASGQGSRLRTVEL